MSLKKPERKKCKPVGVSIEADLMKRAKEYAADRHMSFSALVSRLLRDKIDGPLYGDVDDDDLWPA